MKQKVRKVKRNPMFDFAADGAARKRFGTGLDLMAMAADQRAPWTGEALASLYAVFAGDDTHRVELVERLHQPFWERSYRTGVDAIRRFAGVAHGDLVVDSELLAWVGADPLRRLQAWIMLGWGFDPERLVGHIDELAACADPTPVPIELWDVTSAADRLRAAGSGPWNDKLVKHARGPRDESSWAWLGRLAESVGISTADGETRIDVALGVLAAGLGAGDGLAGHVALRGLIRSHPDPRMTPAAVAAAAERNAGSPAGRLAAWLDSHWEGACAARRTFALPPGNAAGAAEEDRGSDGGCN